MLFTPEGKGPFPAIVYAHGNAEVIDPLPTWLNQSIPSLVTMFVSGIWHGAGLTFIVWGIYYGVLIAGYQLAGLLMYGDDDNYAKADIVAFNAPGAALDLRRTETSDISSSSRNTPTNRPATCSPSGPVTSACSSRRS